MSSIASAQSLTATPPLWPKVAISPLERLSFLQSSFVARAAASSQPSVLIVPDIALYLVYRTLPIYADAGVAVDLLCPRGHPLARSRYVRHVCEVANWAEAESHIADFLRLEHRPWRRILIEHEPSARRLIASLDEAALATWQPGALTSPAREFFLGKFGLVAANAAWDLPIPPTQICRDAAQLREFAAEHGWPVIIKPPDQLGGAGIRKFQNDRELAAASGSLKFPLLAQKFIFGPRLVLDFFCSRGRPLVWLSTYSLRQAHGPFSYSTARLFRAMPALAPLVEKLAARTRFEGFCGADCIEETGTGRVYLLEFNPRLMSGFRSARLCGVDCTPAMKAWVGECSPPSAPITLPAGCEIPVHYFPTDLTRCLRQRDWRGLKTWLPGARARHDFCLDDLGVMLASSLSRLNQSVVKK